MAYDTNLGPGLMELTRNVPAAYDCGVDGCGGGLSTENPDTIIYWNHGTCISQDTCLSVIHHNYTEVKSYCDRSIAAGVRIRTGLMSLAMQGCRASRSSVTLPVEMESVSVQMCVTVRTGGQEMTVEFHSASEHTHIECQSTS